MNNFRFSGRISASSDLERNDSDDEDSHLSSSNHSSPNASPKSGTSQHAGNFVSLSTFIHSFYQCHGCHNCHKFKRFIPIFRFYLPAATKSLQFRTLPYPCPDQCWDHQAHLITVTSCLPRPSLQCLPWGGRTRAPMAMTFIITWHCNTWESWDLPGEILFFVLCHFDFNDQFFQSDLTHSWCWIRAQRGAIISMFKQTESITNLIIRIRIINNQHIPLTKSTQLARPKQSKNGPTKPKQILIQC